MLGLRRVHREMGTGRTKACVLVAICTSAACADAIVPPPPSLLTIDSIVSRGSSSGAYFIGLGKEIHVAFDIGPDRVEARLTPSFDETFVLHGEIDDDRLVLVPDGEFRAAADGGTHVLWIEQLELEAERVSDSEATFGSRVVFSGHHNGWSGDVGGYHEIEGEGTLSEDTSPPTVTLETHLVDDSSGGPLRLIDTPGRSRPLAPWDPIVLSFSEPVRPRDVMGALRVVSASGREQSFRSVEADQPVFELELAPEPRWESTPMMRVEVASFEDLAGNPSEPATVEVSAADFETGRIYGETTVPVEAECGATDDCIAFSGGGCEAGGAILRTGPTPELRVIAPESPPQPPYAHAEIFHAPLEGGTPAHQELSTPYGTDAGWLSFELPSSAQQLFAVHVTPEYCWGRVRDLVPATIVLRR